MREIPFNRNSLSSGFVWGLDEDASHRIWMATLAGLESWQPQTGQFALYSPMPSGDVGANQLQAVHVDRGGRIWVGAESMGVCIFFDPANGRFTPVTDPHRSDQRFSDDRIWHFAEDAQGMRIWVSTTIELVALDSKSATIVEPRIPASKQIPLLLDAIRVSLVDSDGECLWFGGGGAD